MPLFHGFGFNTVVVAIGLVAGCHTAQKTPVSSGHATHRANPTTTGRLSETARAEAESTIQPIAHQANQDVSDADRSDVDEPLASSPIFPETRKGNVLSSQRLFEDTPELSLERLIQEVLARNPSITEMVAAWQAASARFPQVTSLDDPILAVTLGPATYGSQNVNPAYRVNIEQRYPFPGKLRLRGEQARAEANAAGHDIDNVRLELIQSTRSAFYNYFMVYKAIAVNEEGLQLLEKLRSNAQTRYISGLAPQQDVTQADVELGRQRETLLSLEQLRQIGVARINTLLNLPPDATLPLPPSEIRAEVQIPDAIALHSLALNRRPDILALANRIEADQATLALANKEFYPDFTPFFMYDRFMGNTTASEPLAYMVGTSMNIPVRKDRRCAAVVEAQALLNQRRAELEKQINQINYEVQQVYAQVTQGKKAMRLYEESVLPAASANVESALAAYTAGTIPFLSLIEAQRSLVSLRDRYFELVATYHIRLATLERVIGGPLESTVQGSVVE